MKVAVCLSGLSRSVNYSLPIIKKYLVEPYDADVFVHSWSDIAIGGGSVRYAEAPLRPVDDSFFLNAGIKSVKQEPFNDLKWNFLNVNHIDKSIVPMLYSIYRSNELKSQYEDVNNMKYDIVIRSRMDSFYREYIPDGEIDSILNYNYDVRSWPVNPAPCYVTLSAKFRGIYADRNDFHLDGVPMVPDNFAFGSSRTMDLYSGVYLNLHEFSRVVPMAAEFYLARQMLVTGIFPLWSDIEFDQLLKVESNRIQIGSTYKKDPYDELKYIPCT